MVFWMLLIVAAAIGFGVWRKFGPIQWIWLLFGTAIALVVIWVILLVFIIGPGMLETGPPGRR